VDNVTRFDEESIQLFGYKGIEVRNFPLGDPRWGRQVIVKVPVTCKQLTKKGCKLKDKRPLMCKVFPNQFYHNWILHKDCCFYEKEKHWHWYDLTPFTPPKGIQ